MNLKIKKVLTGIILVSNVLVIASCQSTDVYYDEPSSPVPPEPMYPRVYSAELQCLSDNTYEKLVERDIKKSEYIKLLRNLLVRDIVTD